MAVSKSWEKGSTWAWRKTRAHVLNRDAHTCQLKLNGCTTVATHVHHIDGKTHGDNPDRLTAACAHCNLTLGEPKGDPKPEQKTTW